MKTVMPAMEQETNLSTNRTSVNAMPVMGVVTQTVKGTPPMKERKNNDGISKVLSHVYLVTDDGERVELTHGSTTTSGGYPFGLPSNGGGNSVDLVTWRKMAEVLAYALRYSNHPSVNSVEGHLLRKDALTEYDELVGE